MLKKIGSVVSELKKPIIFAPKVRNMMEDFERLQKQRELIEIIGIQNEREGYQPVTARIMGLLMVMDKEEFTFDEIVEEMKISKSTASNALKNLELRGVIEYVTYPGDRKRYFRFISADIDDMVNDIEKKIIQNLDTVHQILTLKKNPNSRNSLFLKNILKGMEFFRLQLDQFRKEYKRNR
jgi:DNA-binding transcriptional regulator GbsR (MarR family)